MDEGLELALGFHAANNLFTALLVSADWTALQTHSVLKDISPAPESMPLEEVIVPVFVIFPILIMVFARKYGWKPELNLKKSIIKTYNSYLAEIKK